MVVATALAEQVGIVFQILLAPSTLILGPDLLVLLNNEFCIGRYWSQVYQLPRVDYGPGKWDGSIVVRWICCEHVHESMF